jgi:hypothetical protein
MHSLIAQDLVMPWIQNPSLTAHLAKSSPKLSRVTNFKIELIAYGFGTHIGASRTGVSKSILCSIFNSFLILDVHDPLQMRTTPHILHVGRYKINMTYSIWKGTFIWKFWIDLLGSQPNFFWILLDYFLELCSTRFFFQNFFITRKVCWKKA